MHLPSNEPLSIKNSLYSINLPQTQKNMVQYKSQRR